MHGLRRSLPLALILIVTASVSAAFAQSEPAGGDPGGGLAGFDVMRNLVIPLVLAAVFTLVGLILFGVCLWLVVKMAPFSVRKEIEEDQNIALGIIVGSMILGIAIILAAAIMG